MHFAYTAGPISGMTWDDATLWRHVAKGYMGDRGVFVLDPMRDKKPPLSRTSRLSKSGCGTLTTQKAIVERDFADVRRSGVILCNFLGATHTSIGTMFELAWAMAYKIPVVGIFHGADKENVHDHPFVNEAIAFRTYDLYQGMEAALSVLAV